MFNLKDVIGASNISKQTNYRERKGAKSYVAYSVIDLTKPEVVRYYTYPLIAAANSNADDFNVIPFYLRFVNKKLLLKHLQSTKYASYAVNLLEKLNELFAILANINAKVIEQNKEQFERIFSYKFAELLGSENVYVHQLYNRHKYNLTLFIRVRHLLENILEPLPGIGYYMITEEYYKLLLAVFNASLNRRRLILKLRSDIYQLQKLQEAIDNKYVSLLKTFYEEILLPMALNASQSQYLFNMEAIAGSLFHAIISEIALTNNFLLNLVLVKKFLDILSDLDKYKEIIVTPTPKLLEILRSEYDKIANTVSNLNLDLHNLVRQFVNTRNAFRQLIQHEIDFANACYLLGYNLADKSDIKPDVQLKQLKTDIESELIEAYTEGLEILYDYKSQMKQIDFVLQQLNKVLQIGQNSNTRRRRYKRRKK